VSDEFPAWARRRRLALGFTQAQVAERAGMDRANYVAIESGRRKAGGAAQRRILDVLAARPGDILMKNRNAVQDVVKRHGFEAARVFGSVARHVDTADSDIDLLVAPAGASISLLSVVALEADLEELLSVPVDVAVDSGEASDDFVRLRREAVPL